MNMYPILSILAAFLLATATPGGPAILSPSAGQALQGSVPIVVNTAVDGFKYAELVFSYARNPTGTWFFIADMGQSGNGEKIADWDTTTLTDGNYNLRLVITLQDGSQITETVQGLRIRNYTPIETATPTLPAPTATGPTATSKPGDTPVPTATLVPSPSPIPLTATPLPLNPAQVSPAQLEFSLTQGALVTFVVFAFFGLVLALRRKIKYRA